MKPNPRSRARRLAMQSLYEWQLSGNTIDKIISQYAVDQQMRNVDEAYFRELSNGVAGHSDELDQSITAYITRPYDEIDPVEKAVLRLGAYELKFSPEVPYRVIINEAVELAKTFGAEASHKFINGIMDKLAAELRGIEMQAHKYKKS
ncbi:MAG: transcription antitermination factor NusB [Thiohalophilus sp.]|uniref:transcription antitermination factor NusB n=1 Tax=Thiohalophilus sp. TaxID=3028392 RepID=UPI00287016E7|nr:transcription antitermination factor NusB [Thiohalophilus sp.]MDR9435693.1 transcription antitermination factor NusB [Thiohalophilus sp.]